MGEAQVHTTRLDHPRESIPSHGNMIHSVEIKRFRCFREVKVEGLRRVNVLVGGNGSGKTAFLEALFMCAGMGADVFARIQRWRGAAWPTLNQITTGSAFRDIWRGMFFDFDDLTQISIDLFVGEARFRSLKIHYGTGQDVSPIALNPQAETTSSITVPLKFEGQTESGETFAGPVTLGPHGPMFIPAAVKPYPMALLPPAALLDSEVIARLFSDLSIRERHGSVVDAVRELFPFVASLSVEIQGASNAVYASVRGLPQKLHIGALSAGIYKYLAMLVTIATEEQGVVAVDEIENGLYYRNLESMWKSIADFSRGNGTQLFVTTHSLECLRAMLPAIAEAPEDFALLRAERENGESRMKVFDGEHFEAALEQNFEIR